MFDIDVRRHASVVEIRERVFIWSYLLNKQGLWRAFAVSESSRDPASLGQDLRHALESPWPDIVPAWPELMRPLLKAVGVTSERRFVAWSNSTSVDRAGDRITMTPMKPDGRSGYNGVAGVPTYELIDPTDAELGEYVLRALSDSAAFPDRPNVR